MRLIGTAKQARMRLTGKAKRAGIRLRASVFSSVAATQDLAQIGMGTETGATVRKLQTGRSGSLAFTRSKPRCATRCAKRTD